MDLQVEQTSSGLEVSTYSSDKVHVLVRALAFLNPHLCESFCFFEGPVEVETIAEETFPGCTQYHVYVQVDGGFEDASETEATCALVQVAASIIADMVNTTRHTPGTWDVLDALQQASRVTGYTVC